MGSLGQLETSLDEVLNKKAPVSLPPEARKSIAGILWIIALIVGVLQLWAAITLWQWGHAVDRVSDALSYYTGSVYVAPHLGVFYYLSLLAMGVVAVLALVAVPSLKAMKKSGWDFLFYGALIGAVLAVIRLFSSVGGGFDDFLGTAVGTVLGAWLLFQARDYFTSAPAGHVSSTSGHHTEKAVVEKPASDKTDQKK
jgi:uncharacterized membrane protein HdeD (DUF308 family)